VLAQMRETLVKVRVGLEDLRIGISSTRVRLAEERQKLETVRRRKELARGIGDEETVSVAERFEAQHAERVAVLERKLAVQEEELALVESEADEMNAEFKAAHAGVAPPGGTASADAVRDAAARAEVEEALGGRDSVGDELDALRRSEERATREARADAMLSELKRRMGR